jgi:hypothetical protein
MTASESTTTTDPLDLLRRFIPAPFTGSYATAGVCLTVQTNDLTLLPALRLMEGEGGSGEPTLECRLIRDGDSGGVLDVPRTFACRPVTVVEMGSACFFALDHERREILGFIGSRIDGRTYQDFVVPLLCRMAREACYSGEAAEASE